MIFDFFRERIGEPRKPSNPRSHAEILALDIRSRDVLRVGVSHDALALTRYADRWAVPRLLLARLVHALVNVGILALQNGASVPGTLETPLYVAWSSAEAGAASGAIRAIRRSMSEQNKPELPPDDATGWSVTVTSLDAWRQRPSWLPGAGALGPLLGTIEARTGTKVSDIFHVRQGIRTGGNEVFVQPAIVVKKLPRHEQRYFREAVDAASFVDGEIKPRKYLFVLDHTWKTESEVSQAVPQFFQKYLQTGQESLAKRKSLPDHSLVGIGSGAHVGV